MALSANAAVKGRGAAGIIPLHVKAATRIYRNGITSIDTGTGYARPFAASSGDVRGGIAREECDNSAGAGGAKQVEVYTEGEFLLTGSGFAQTDVGTVVYGSADDAVTKTSTNNLLLGRISEFVSSTKVWVRLLGFAVAS